MITSIIPSTFLTIFLQIIVIIVCATEPVKLTLNDVYNKNDSTKSMLKKVLKSRSIRSFQSCTATYDELFPETEVLEVFRKHPTPKALSEINCSRRSYKVFPDMSYDIREDNVNITNNIFFNLSYNAVDKLERKNFKNLYFIVRLFLSHNQIQNISEDAFHDLHCLKELDLSYNNISKLEYKTFSLNKNITILSLKKNRITSISENLFNGLTELITIDLSQNEIDFIESEVFSSNRKLENISLNDNKLIHFTLNIEDLPFEHLYIHNNPWKCDCNLLLFIHLYEETVFQDISNNNFFESTCRLQNEIQFMSWKNIINSNQLEKCYSREYTKLTMYQYFLILFIIIIVLILMVLYVKFYFNIIARKTIRNSPKKKQELENLKYLLSNLHQRAPDNLYVTVNNNGEIVPQ